MDLGTGAINNEYWGIKMIEIITQEQIQNVLLNEHRQYLVGDLKLPQRLQYIYDDKVEMGITRFEKYACEKPHFHPIVTEYQIILNGEAKYVDIEANREYMVKAGDIIEIREKSKQLPLVISAMESAGRDVPAYLEVDSKKFSAKYSFVPKFEDVPYASVMEPNMVIEFYSR